MSTGAMPPSADTRSGTSDPTSPPPPGGATLPRTRGGAAVGRADRLFRGLSLSAGVLVLVIILAIGVFLVLRAIPALRADDANFFTEKTFFPNDPKSPVFGIAALAFGTLLTSVLALVISFPVSVGVALFISHYAPRRLSAVLGYVIDLLAAVPSVVYGLWGLYFLNPRVQDTSTFLDKHLGWIPLFSTNGTYGSSVFLAGVVLAIMILPIIASLSREVFLQVPRENQEAALALGATRWEMIRTAVLPFGRPGVIGATMLGLGRALGETIAVALVLSSSFKIDLHILQPGGNSIAANIANGFGEANATGRGALIASGLVLFAITLVVNVAARAVIYRRSSFSGGSL